MFTMLHRTSWLLLVFHFSPDAQNGFIASANKTSQASSLLPYGTSWVCLEAAMPAAAYVDYAKRHFLGPSSHWTELYHFLELRDCLTAKTRRSVNDTVALLIHHCCVVLEELHCVWKSEVTD